MEKRRAVQTVSLGTVVKITFFSAIGTASILSSILSTPRTVLFAVRRFVKSHKTLKGE